MDSQTNPSSWRSLWPHLVAAIAIATLLSTVPFLRFIFNYLGVLSHELGHALTAWCFGYPSIPAFDMQYGGGVTVHAQRHPAFCLGPLAFFAWLAWHHRSNQKAIFVWSGFACVYLLFAVTPIHKSLILIMGHGTELLIALIFCYRFVGARSIKVAGERALYGAMGLFLVAQAVRFAHRLMSSFEARELYGLAKGGGHWMDFSRLAGRLDVAGIATVYFWAALAVPVVAYFIARYREELAEWLVEVAGA